MTNKTRAKSRILDAVHETARDLHTAGFIDKRRMREYDALCLAPIPDYSSEKNPCAAHAPQAEPGGAGIGAEHEPIHRAPMGDRRQAPKRPLPQAAQPA